MVGNPEDRFSRVAAQFCDDYTFYHGLLITWGCCPIYYVNWCIKTEANDEVAFDIDAPIFQLLLQSRHEEQL